MRCETAEIAAENAERSCGFLTQSEREYLLGEKEYDLDGEKMKRYDIRVRARHALADFYLLHEYASEDLKSGVLETGEDVNMVRDTTLEHIGEGMMGFAIDALVGEEFSEIIEEMTLKLPSVIEAAESGDVEDMLKEYKKLSDPIQEEMGISDSEIMNVRK